jgi:hypothetical protein
VEQTLLMLGIVMMLVAPVGIVLYVALVIAIPVCRALDWLFGSATDEQSVRPSTGRSRPDA